jgi:hypothetical protein
MALLRRAPRKGGAGRTATQLGQALGPPAIATERAKPRKVSRIRPVVGERHATTHLL